MPHPLPKLVVLLGPTASGKTDLAIALAKRFKGEIVSCDSRQFYRGMAIGAAIPEGEWATRRGVRAYWVDGVAHHLMAFRSPRKPLTAAEFKRLADRRIAAIVRRGHIPCLVGGTGLYADAVMLNFAFPPVEAAGAARAALEALPTERLARMLTEADPAYAARISLQNRRYMIRALEVAQTAPGERFSALQRRGKPRYDVLLLGVTRDRADLYARIDRRAGLMMDAGLLQEASRLGRRYGWDAKPLASLGHRQLGEFLRGETSLPEAVERMKRETRRYAKRQMTWLRRENGLVWVRNVAEATRKVKAFLGSK